MINKMLYGLSALAIVLLLFKNLSCSNVQMSNFEETILIDFNDHLIKNASELFNDVSYLHLNTGIDKPIGEITSLKAFDSILVVFDESQESLFLFDDKGFYVSSVRKHGRGPGEYLSISDYNIIDGHLYVLTNRSNIDKYSLNGSFIERIGSTPMFIDQFQIDKDGYIMLSKLNGDRSRIFIFDKGFNLLERKLPYKNDNVPLFNFWPELPMFSISSNVFFYLPEDYGIYSYSSHGLIPKYKYRFKGVSVDLDKLSANEIKSSMLPVVRGTFLIDDYLVTQVAYENNMYQHVYSFSSRKSKLYNVFEINNDLDNLLMLWSLSYGASDKNLYSVIPFDLFNRGIDGIKFLNEFFKDVDNPVIGVFTIKEF